MRNADLSRRYQYWSTIPKDMLVRSAEEKLICHTTFSPSTEEQVFAVFSARLLLELAIEEASAKLAILAIEKHVRFFLGFALNDALESCAPSEAMLAIAAGNLLLDSPTLYQDAMRTFLRELVLRGIVLRRGLAGELLGRILLMLHFHLYSNDDPFWIQGESGCRKSR
jgi:hypothetical protein